MRCMKLCVLNVNKDKCCVCWQTKKKEAKKVVQEFSGENIVLYIDQTVAAFSYLSVHFLYVSYIGFLNVSVYVRQNSLNSNWS